MSGQFFYGGQAVTEGVMIRGRSNLSIAVRSPDGAIALHTEPLSTLYTGRLRDIPLVRGIIVLVETLVLGVKALMYSANAALETQKAEPPGAMVWATLAISMLFVVGLFFVAPLLAIRALDRFIASALLSNLLEGALRLALFAGYLKAVNLMPDIRRVFAYHGAEHKAVHALEYQAPMDVPSVRRYSKAHARCGTAFLLAVLIIAILVFALLGRPALWLSILSRIVLVPVIAALGYEFIRWGGGHYRNPVVKAILGPSLALQALTTREPDDGQIEVAIRALKGALVADGVLQEEAHGMTDQATAGAAGPGREGNARSGGLLPPPA